MTKAAKYMGAKIDLLCEAYTTKMSPAEFSERLANLNANKVLSNLHDGRALAWSEERRKAQGEKIAAAWAEKRKAKAQLQEASESFLKFTYSDQPPEKLKNLDEVAKDCGLHVRTLRNKLSENADGFVVKVGRIQVAYVQSAERLEDVLTFQARLYGDEDLRIALPRKAGKRF